MKQILLIFILCQIVTLNFFGCRDLDFISKGKNDSSVSVEFHGQLILPPNYTDDLPAFDDTLVKTTAFIGGSEFIQDWNDDLTFIQDWNDELGFIQDWNDELGFIQDWNDELGYVKGWDKDNLVTLENRNLTLLEFSGGKKMVQGAIPTGPKGIFKFTMKKSSSDSALQILALGFPDNIFLFSIITDAQKIMVDLYSDYSFRLILELANSGSSQILKLDGSQEDSTLVQNLTKQIYEVIKTIHLNDISEPLESKKINLRNMILSEKKEELNSLLIKNTPLLEMEIENLLEILYQQAASNTDIQPAITPAPKTGNSVFNVTTEEENLAQFPSDKNKWILLKGEELRFTMGNNYNIPTAVQSVIPDDKVFSFQKPEHEVVLSPFGILKFEVSVGLYKKCLEEKVCTYSAKETSKNNLRKNKVNFPVNFITFEEAQVFCTWLGGKLPTEAQWEFAARGDSLHNFVWGNNLNKELSPYVNFQCLPTNFKKCSETLDGTGPVGNYPEDKSLFGIYDMNGNVTEWVEDLWADDFYSKKEAVKKDPVNNLYGEGHVLRGPSFVDGPKDLPITSRFEANYLINDSSSFWEAIGFRCVKSLK